MMTIMTIDEVIEAITRDEYYCVECPLQYSCGGSEVGCYLSEASRYLIEYRDMKKRLACLDSHTLHGDDTKVINNPPLTWQELKQMEGKPVWVEDNIDEPEDTTKYWAIYQRIEKAQETEYALLSDFYYDKAQYGNIWQAYRKERGCHL